MAKVGRNIQQKPNQRTKNQIEEPKTKTEIQKPKRRSKNRIGEPKTKSENQKPKTENQKTKSENQKPNQRTKNQNGEPMVFEQIILPFCYMGKTLSILYWQTRNLEPNRFGANKFDVACTVVETNLYILSLFKA